jgi:serine protein kinase
VTRNAFQRVYDMIIAAGSRGVRRQQEEALTRYNFFRDDSGLGRDAVFGLDIPLMRLVNVLKAAAEGYGPERRVILLHGPVGSSKSTIARLLKKGLEEYSRTPEGALYTYTWVNLEGTGLVSGDEGTFPSPMHEEPLRLIPRSGARRRFKELGLGNDRTRSRPEGDLNPACRYIFKSLMDRYNGDWAQVVGKHIRVRRLLLSEKDRVGIGTFQPKDEKNQDSTELTGDINYRKIAEYGSDSDPRAFNFDGEFNIANRGIVEFVEVLKLDVAFLYDLLGASQEHRIKPKKFAQTDIDEVIIGHTNEAEYKKLLANEFMEALRDRTIKIDIPYITRLSEEVKIYEKSFSSGRCGASTSRRTRWRWPRCGPSSRGWKTRRSTTSAAPEDEALRRPHPPRVHPGHGEGAAQGYPPRGHGRHLARASCRTCSPTPWCATRSPRSTPSW